MSPGPPAPEMEQPRAPPDEASAKPPKNFGLKGGWEKLKQEMHNVVPEKPSVAEKNAAPKHVAVLKDNSLRELLIEAFKIAEIRFQNFDNDRAGMLMFDEVKHDIGKDGFYDEARLIEIWRRCDIDRSNTIDFSEFLYFLYMWQHANEIASNISMFSPGAIQHPQVGCQRSASSTSGLNGLLLRCFVLA